MITVDFRYKTKSGEIKTGSQIFETPNKAVRFIHGMKCKGLQYMGYSCDTYDELEDMEYKV